MTEKTVYQYDKSGYFVGETTADESPLEQGVWHMPARTTEENPPVEWPGDKWPRFDGVRWFLAARPSAVNDNDPVSKLKAFLAANPDVAAIL